MPVIRFWVMLASRGNQVDHRVRQPRILLVKAAQGVGWEGVLPEHGGQRRDSCHQLSEIVKLSGVASGEQGAS